MASESGFLVFGLGAFCVFLSMDGFLLVVAGDLDLEGVLVLVVSFSFETGFFDSFLTGTGLFLA